MALNAKEYQRRNAAHAGGGQANATPLTTMVNRVTVVATAGDSVALPTLAPGLEITVIDASATSMDVYPKNGSGDAINLLAANAAYVHAAAKVVTFFCVTAGQWCTSVA